MNKSAYVQKRTFAAFFLVPFISRFSKSSLLKKKMTRSRQVKCFPSFKHIATYKTYLFLLIFFEDSFCKHLEQLFDVLYSKMSNLNSIA